jgi:signal transduction histidine kinase
LLGLLSVYVATAKLGLALDPVGGFATLVWPPTGIALAALVRRGPGLWPAVAVGAAVANLTSGAPWPVALGIAVGNTLEALLGARMLCSIAGYTGPIVRVRHAVALLGAALVAPLVSASFGVLSLHTGNVLTTRGVGVWTAWWLGDVLGALVVAPVLLNLGIPRQSAAPVGSRALEALGLIAAVLASAALSFSGDPAAPLRRPHMIFPALIWAAIRFDTWVSSLMVLSISCVAITITARGTGPYVAGTTLHENLTALQGFMGTVALTSIFLAAANTERAAAQLALKRDEEALRAALGMRDEFLSIASHELRTPLAALSLQVEGLERTVSKRSNGSEESQRELHRAGRAVAHVERLARIVDNLFDVSQITAGRLQLGRETFDLAEAVRAVASALSEQAARAGCSVTLSAPDAVTGYWDRFRIEQVITNLLTNAFKYGAGKPIEVSVQATEAVARLRVRDQGSGVAPEAVERIFDRFERFATGHHQWSLGVGLYIARQVIDAHSGVVRVEETSSSGSTFLVELPRTPPP